MVKMSDHEVDGHVNWQAYHAARKACGEECQRCGRMIGIFHTAKGVPETCGPCIGMMTGTEKIDSERAIRCPACRRQWNPSDNEDYHLYDEGDEHDVACPDCGHDFQVSTRVTHTWTSPAIVDQMTDDEREALGLPRRTA